MRLGRGLENRTPLARFGGVLDRQIVPYGKLSKSNKKPQPVETGVTEKTAAPAYTNPHRMILMTISCLRLLCM
jgi:hypothetical protein